MYGHVSGKSPPVMWLSPVWNTGLMKVASPLVPVACLTSCVGEGELDCGLGGLQSGAVKLGDGGLDAGRLRRAWVGHRALQHQSWPGSGEGG